MASSQQVRWSLGPEGLEKLPEEILLKVAIELDPDTVAEFYEAGWTKKDFLNVIKKHVRASVGSRQAEGWQFVSGVEVFTEELER